MNKYQLNQVLEYLDAEYAGIVNRMTETERKTRAKHWAQEIGSLDFDVVMAAVKKLARGQYMPRTAEVLTEVEKSGKPKRAETPYRIIRDFAGNEMLMIRYDDGVERMSGYLDKLPEWMQLKFRWLADPTPENTAAWDAVILREERARNVLMTMEAA